MAQVLNITTRSSGLIQPSDDNISSAPTQVAASGQIAIPSADAASYMVAQRYIKLSIDRLAGFSYYYSGTGPDKSVEHVIIGFQVISNELALADWWGQFQFR
ncbi:MAG: hypothetical protein GY839_01190 [candidate division Zixibacteria bacterium]|nr:hypothetical protein [candidate division Zixibacteria bacterium]